MSWQQVLPFLPLIPLFFRKVLEVSGNSLFLGVIYSEKFAVYKVAVVNGYLQKCAQPEEDWQIKPTRGRIRQLCRKLIENGLEKRDEKILREYLEMEPGEHDFLTAIKRTDADDFQGLLQFLNKTEINPAEINVELLAVFIGFPERPFAEYINRLQSEPILIKKDGNEVSQGHPDNTIAPDIVVSAQEEPASEEKEVDKKTVEEDITKRTSATGEKGDEPPVEPDKFNLRWLIRIAAILMVGVMIWRFLPEEKKCMYWSGDRYVKTYCDVPRLDTPLVLIDQTKLRDFRKIKKTDTLSSPYAQRHFWYTRVADSLEIYTASGTHPLYPDKQFEPVTDYVVNFCKNHSKYGKP